jgi:shikimate kinase
LKGKAVACGAATILNAVANWKGSAFGVGLRTEAEVILNSSGKVKGDVPGVDTRLVVRCVEKILERFGRDLGATVRTRSEVPVASGLKSSSTAANASVLAALDALGAEMELFEAAVIGVSAAKEVGVTITGALDDALASMLGGVVVTDNREMKLLRREETDSAVILLVPDKKVLSKDTDVGRSRLVAPLADVAFDLALKGDYGRAMTLNGLMYCAALGFSAEPIMAALKAGAWGASLSGTGPAYAALAPDDKVDEVSFAWEGLGGRVIRAAVNNQAASMGWEI